MVLTDGAEEKPEEFDTMAQDGEAIDLFANGYKRKRI